MILNSGRIFTCLACLGLPVVTVSCGGNSSEPTAADVAVAAHATENTESMALVTFDDGIPPEVRLLNADAEPVDGALRVRFHSAENEDAGLEIVPDEPFDWSRLDDFSIAFDIANEGEVSTQLFLNVYDATGGFYTRSVVVPVGPARTYYSKMRGHDLGSPGGNEQVDLNLASGLRSNPATWEGDDVQFVWMWGNKLLDTSAITRISLSVSHNLRDKEITLSNVRLMQNPPMNENYLNRIVDRYGQPTRMEFQEKIHSDEELIAQRDRELAELDGEAMADRSKFSGWANGPRLEATGYFRTEKVDGKWSLVDPEGYLYFATGIDIIRLANSTTMTGYDFDRGLLGDRAQEELTPEDSQGLNTAPESVWDSRHLVSETRADMFSWLPASYDDPLANHFGYRREAHSGPLERGETFSFYSANLERKYGEDAPRSYLKIWRDVTIDRMLDWGFTSLGNWTDPMFYDNQKIPYFANGWIIGEFKTVSSGNDFWAGLPDVFDPLFAERADATVRQVAAEVKGSPWCVGVFIDNEKSWGRSETRSAQLGIVINTLGRDGAESPTKARFTELMKEQYGEIERLNAAWGMALDSWQAFDAGGFDTALSNEAQEADYSKLLYTYASEYFRIVEAAMQKYMPNHLYLGARFADWGMPPEVVKASARYTDVVSFNWYKEGVTKEHWSFLPGLDMPAIIGEFHFGTTSSGFFHPGLLHAADQVDRARMYTEYMETVIDNDYLVGAHWFQYIDSPITGRAHDGENYNVGFVTVADVPYGPMVRAAKALHSDMYERRFGTGSE